jgi:hypothetical protein
MGLGGSNSKRLNTRPSYPFSLREKAGMRGSKSNAIMKLDPLTLTLSLREREQKRRSLLEFPVYITL